MSFGATKLLAASGGEDYEIDQSVLLDDGDGALLHRTPSSEGNRKTWTFSCWFKRSQQDSTDNTSGYYYLFASSIYGGNETFIRVQGDHLQVSGYDGGSYDFSYYSNFLLRDISAWYHVVVICDTTESTETDRVKVYLNGSQVTDWGSPNHPSLNFDTMINNTNWHAIGAYKASSGDGGLYRWDGYVAEAYLLDGTAKAVTAFGETDSETGQWIPKKTGFSSSEYGTNGFYLKFVSGAIGTDSSGEGNNYTTVNLANSDVMLDTPTNNYPTINSVLPLDTTLVKLYQGNLRTYGGAQSGGNGQANSFCTFQMPSSGKWYVESYVGIGQGSAGGNIAALGVIESTFVLPNTDAIMFSQAGFTGLVFSTYQDFAKLYDGGSAVATVTGLTATEYVVALAIDVDNGKVYVGYDSGSSITWLNSGNPAGNSNGTAHTFSTDTVIGVHLSVDGGSPANTADLRLNFGQNGTFNGGETAGGNTDSVGEGNFFYSVPSGFKALCTKNLPTPTIKLSTNHFNTKLYTGNGATAQEISLDFNPDLVWIKSRSDTEHHSLVDRVRGDVAVNSDQNIAQYAVDAFDFNTNNTVDVPVYANDYSMNTNSDNYVMWHWLAGGTAPSKTYTTKVVSDSGNKYRFNDYGTSAVTLNLQEGGTYTFDQSDSSNSGHPLRFSTTSDGSHGGGSEYTTGVTTSGTPGSSGAYTRITVAASAPTLYYYCTAHSGMGGQANTNITFGSTNLDGGSLSTVSVNTTAGVSIINVVGTGSSTTYGHGLGVIPKVYIVKLTSGTGDWYLQTSALDGGWDYLQLNSTAASNSMSATAPTSSVLYSNVTSSATAVFYAFAEIASFSKFGSYKGNGNANGTYIYTGFRPAWTMIKRTDSTNSWIISDSKISPINLIDDYLAADLAQAEATTSAVGIDFLSNGFKIRNNANAMNNSSGTYFYMAFAKFPFKYANAR